MKHTTEVVKHPDLGPGDEGLVKIMSDEAIAVCVQCCGDPTTRSVRTIYGVHAMTQEQLEAEIEAHHDEVKKRHEGRTNAVKLISGGIKNQLKLHG